MAVTHVYAVRVMPGASAGNKLTSAPAIPAKMVANAGISLPDMFANASQGLQVAYLTF